LGARDRRKVGLWREGAVANRLAAESSPYLLLHAHNPVDWYPWGEEAFDTARSEDRPIFLSVGYSTCYWCHVMERESFSDPDTARAMNEAFVNIKVDREERPDVDEIYMTATQLLTRSGGWPNSLFLTPDLKPFFAGTYFPLREGLGRPSFPQILQALREAWALKRGEVLQRAEAVAEAMEVNLVGAREASRARPDPGLVAGLQDELAGRFDPEWGGFGAAPKFPSPSNLDYLLDRAGDDEARRMLLVTLDRMARGGVMDQLAGGFHRYSTDAAWLVPHFEKMLYDNAALARLYAEAAPLAPGGGFERVARFTLDFVLDAMTSPEGGFLSAIDAETDGHEGAYYTWTRDELESELPSADRSLFRAVYGLDGPPTFEAERYVLHVPTPFAQQAERAGMSEDELRQRLEPGRKALLAARDRRKPPLIDDKILTDWNGLMIGATARVGQLLEESRYVEAAGRAAEFVLSRLRNGSGRLLHTFRDGRARVDAFLDDYAFLIEGLLRLREATGEDRWLGEAVRLAEEQEQRLEDAEAGGYYAAGEDPRLLFRAKPAFDGAVASGNGTSALNLIELGAITSESRWSERAEAVLRAFGEGMTRGPFGHVTLVRALARLEEPPPPAPKAEPASSLAPGVSAVESLEEEAREVVEVDGRLGRGDDEVWKPFTVDLEIRRGFHLNPNPGEDPALVATEVTGVLGSLRNVVYPPAKTGDASASGYRGRVRIEGEIEHRGGGAASVELVYQACDEARCLPPVTRLVRLR
jgi:uncharacterized protein YyaL (SSP411 family)